MSFIEEDELISTIALQMVSGVGPVMAKNLIAYCGSAKAVFTESKKHLKSIQGVGAALIDKIIAFKSFDQANAELQLCNKNQIDIIHYLSPDFPVRLKEIYDSPLILFRKGNFNLNAKRIVAIVGTRRMSDYGRKMTDKLIEQISDYQPLIISGLAYGVDTQAHKASLKNQLSTLGVLGHGLGHIYPQENKGLSMQMQENGGLLSEYIYSEKPIPAHFPHRNRIVAGLSDGLLIIETGRKGGALLTAELAHSYDRDVMAVPGKIGEEFSAGCNYLIKSNQAALVESGEDIAQILGWDIDIKKSIPKKKLHELNGIPLEIYQLINKQDKMDFDTLSSDLQIPPSELSMILLSLELEGAIEALPGKHYRAL